MEFMPEYSPLDPPADAKNPQLLITDADRITSLLIGHENSPFHKKIFFPADFGYFVARARAIANALLSTRVAVGVRL